MHKRPVTLNLYIPTTFVMVKLFSLPLQLICSEKKAAECDSHFVYRNMVIRTPKADLADCFPRPYQNAHKIINLHVHIFRNNAYFQFSLCVIVCLFVCLCVKCICFTRMYMCSSCLIDSIIHDKCD